MASETLIFFQALQSILQALLSQVKRVKMQKIDDDPTPVPKIKGARRDTNVNQVAVIELCHNDEDMIPEGWEDNAMVPDSEDEYIAEQGEGQGPPNVSADKLQQLDERAALDEVAKLFQMDVIQPVVLTDSEASTENVVDTTWYMIGGIETTNG